jgi:hypothetical protein
MKTVAEDFTFALWQKAKRRGQKTYPLLCLIAITNQVISRIPFS